MYYEPRAKFSKHGTKPIPSTFDTLHSSMTGFGIQFEIKNLKLMVIGYGEV